MIILLGLFRTSTEAEFAFASAAIIPVVLVSWVNGFAWACAVAVLAAIMWVFSDHMTAREFSSDWIPFVNGSTRFATYLFVAYLTAITRKALAEQTELATLDALTGLPNRRSFVSAGKAELLRAIRYSRPLAVIFIDLDDFKALNDAEGHETGDTALKAVAFSLRKSLRETDHVARLGGDEFVVLLPEISENQASHAANKIAAKIASSLLPYAPVSASIGVAWFEKPQGEFSDMLVAADKLMYEVKHDEKRGMRTRAFRPEAPA